ncbi:thioredoxin-like protein [Entophlyctis helioformis]|nr:thioredoxin-like protein [Entophlyctis helioformis]
MEELKAAFNKRQQMERSNHGRYDTIRSEKEILAMTTSTEKKCVVHFCHKDFRRCQIMDRHLEALAKRHYGTRFVRIDVEDAPFLVDRLKIQILPCIISFIDGVSVDRVIGFDGIAGGDRDDFTTAALEQRIASGSKVITMPTETTSQKNARRSTIYGFADAGKGAAGAGDDSDDDY